VSTSGRLPRPLSDAAAVAEGGRILVFGGRDAAGAASDQIIALEPRR
jgi:N-acetylneuraminic acid mutarotase